MNDALPAMTELERNALAEFVSRVRERYGARVRDVRLYGSRARGDARPDSDIDVLVLLDGAVSYDDRRSVTQLACDVALEAPTFVELSPRTMSHGEFERLLAGEWRFALDAAREGMPL